MAHIIRMKRLLVLGPAGGREMNVVRAGILKFLDVRHTLGYSQSRNVSMKRVEFGRNFRGCCLQNSFSHGRMMMSILCHQGNSEANLNVDVPEESDSPQSYGIPEMSKPERWDVVGLGQAMVDFSGTVEDEFLVNLGIVKGTRKVINHEERGLCLRAVDPRKFKASAGGSLSNTLVALARLGAAESLDSSLNVAMTGSVGSDALGGFYRNKLKRANVNFLSKPIPDGTTGTVIVLTTPDAQRSMLSYQGMSSLIDYNEDLEEQIVSSRVLVVEGYLWELPETVETIAKACKTARDNGVLVALTASDVSCVNRHRDKMWDVLSRSADMIFCNADEATALLSGDSSFSPAMAAELLSKCCPLVSVTDGARGSYIALKGEVSYIQPYPCVPVDTCGAGDAYAAGVLYGFLNGVPHLKGIGNLAARVASVVVGQQGTRLKEEDARELASSILTFAHMRGDLINLMANEEQSVSA